MSNFLFFLGPLPPSAYIEYMIKLEQDKQKTLQIQLSLLSKERE